MRLRVFLAGAILSLAITSAACEKPHAQVPSVTLDWTATGDDGAVGTAASYKVFWSSATPDTTGYSAWLNAGAPVGSTPAGILAWVNSAKNATGPVPLVAGSAMSFTITDSFLAGGKYWFMVTACDDGLPAQTGQNPVPNCARSNFTTKVIPTVDTIAPAAIFNLRAR